MAAFSTDPTTCRKCGEPKTEFVRYGGGAVRCRACFNSYKREYDSRPEVRLRARARRASTPFPVTSRRDDVAAFWASVDTSGECWTWTKKHKRRGGYGEFYCSSRRRKIIAPRFAWELWNGPIPGGLYVCHRCDNPPCVRPSHLFLGTALDNVRDAIAKGRIDWESRVNRGTKNGRAKLTEDQVREIRRRRAAGEKLRSLSAAFGVSMTVINHIEKGKLWRSVA